MPQLFDITTSILYQEGMEKGMEKGREKGIEEGAMKKSLILIANLLGMAEMPLEQIAQIVGVEKKLVSLVKTKMDAGEWTHPDQWSEEQWAAYFSK